jgi:hypothetical protein
MAENNVKKVYTSPRLTEHGSVQRLTEGPGFQSIDDFAVFGIHDIFGKPPRTGS